MITASIHGRIGQDPATSQTKTGKAMTRCSIAVDVTGHNASDEESVWVSVMAFNRVADDLARAEKGQTLSAMGRLTRSRYIGKDGTERESWSLLADAVVSVKSARPPGRKASAPAQHGRPAHVDFDDPIDF